MWRNYFTVAVRALAKNRVYALINVVGLTIGLAACLLILLYVRYEQSYDRWLPAADRTFQLQTFYKADSRMGEEKLMQISAIAAGRRLAQDFPEIEKRVWVRSFAPVVIQNGRASQVQDLRMADGNLFEVLGLPLVRGSAATALPDAHAVALSESEAKRRFGDGDPIGRTLTIVDNIGDGDYRVTAVFKDIPKHSSFSAQMIARFDLDLQYADRAQSLTRWDTQGGWNFVRLRPGADADAINARIPAWEKRVIPDQVTNGERFNTADEMDLHLTNIRDVHLGKAQEYGVTPGNDRGTVVTFAVIALLVLDRAGVAARA